MAEQIFKELKTRIALRTGDYAYWTTGAGKDIELYKGEVCVCTVAKADNQAQTAPTVLFKVADANGKKFADLDWCSAKAADVYDWAKKSQEEFITWVNTVVEHPAAPVITTGNENGTIAVDGVDIAVKGLGSAAYTNADAYATSAENGAKQAAADAQKTIDEYAEAHKDDYTNKQIDDAIAAVDTGVHAVNLATGDANGQVKLTVDGESKNVDVKGLASAAYVTVDSLNATAKGYADAVEAKIPTELGVMSVANTDDTIVVGGDGKAVTIKVAENKFDAHGAAAAVLGQSTDGAAANTVYGAKAAAAAAQNDATIAKTKIETFLGTITPDGSQDIIDTLTEINNYVGEHGEEFAALSEKVTKIENGTTVVPKASDADTLDGKQATDFADAAENGAKALAQGVKDVVDANKATWDKAGTAVQDIQSGEDVGAIRVDGKDVYVSGLEDLAFEKTVTTKLITDKAVTKGKLEQSVQDSLGLADTSLQGFVETGKPEGASSKFITKVEKDGTNIKVVYSDELLAEGGLIRLNTNSPQGMQIQSYNTLSLGGNTVDIRGNIVSYGSSFKFNDKDVLTEVQAGTGLKVAEGTSNKIEIDAEVIFVLNANF